MKKAIFVSTIFFAFAFTLSVFAQLATVTVGADIRTRAYVVDNLGDLSDDASGEVTTVADDGTITTTYVQDDQQNYINTLIDLYVDATMTDSVTVRINLEAYGVFGSDIYEDGGLWDVYSWETYLKLGNIKGSAVSATIGSFYVDLGTGFLFSSGDGFYIFDGVMVEADYAPVVVKAAMLRLDDEGKDDRDVYLADVDWMNADETLTVGGTVATIADGPTDYQPIVVDGRIVFQATDAIQIYGEGVYETGDSFGDLDKSAWAAKIGGSYVLDVNMDPTIRAMYIYASGDDDPLDGDDGDFDPLFNYAFYGYAYSPMVTNIQIINLGLDVQATEFTKVFADFYYYTQAEEAAMVMGNTNLDNPGVTVATNGTNDELGSEVDLGVVHDYTNQVTTSLIVSYFFPGDAYGDNADDALEIRGEILVSF